MRHNTQDYNDSNLPETRKRSCNSGREIINRHKPLRTFLHSPGQISVTLGEYLSFPGRISIQANSWANSSKRISGRERSGEFPSGRIPRHTQAKIAGEAGGFTETSENRAKGIQAKIARCNPGRGDKRISVNIRANKNLGENRPSYVRPCLNDVVRRTLVASSGLTRVLVGHIGNRIITKLKPDRSTCNP